MDPEWGEGRNAMFEVGDQAGGGIVGVAALAAGARICSRWRGITSVFEIRYESAAEMVGEGRLHRVRSR